MAVGRRRRMKYDWRFIQKSKCSDREKHQCMKLVSDLVNLSIMARRDGLLSLIQVAEQSSSFLLNKGLQLVVDDLGCYAVNHQLKALVQEKRWALFCDLDQ